MPSWLRVLRDCSLLLLKCVEILIELAIFASVGSLLCPLTTNICFQPAVFLMCAIHFFYVYLSFLATQVFASHSLWHLCVLSAVYVWFHFLIQYQALLKDHGCAAYEYGDYGATAGSSSVLSSPLAACVVGGMNNETCTAF